MARIKASQTMLLVSVLSGRFWEANASPALRKRLPEEESGNSVQSLTRNQQARFQFNGEPNQRYLERQEDAELFWNQYNILQENSMVSSPPSTSPSSLPSAAPSATPSAAPVVPTPAPTTVAPTAAPVTAAPTAAPVTVAPTTAPVTVAPTTAPVTVAPTTAPVTVAPTAAPVTVPPTVATVTVAPTAAPVTIPPSAEPGTVFPTGFPPTSISFAPTPSPTPGFPSLDPSIISSSIFPSDIPLEPTSSPTVSLPVTSAPTMQGDSTDAPTANSGVTVSPTTAPGTNTTVAPTTAGPVATAPPTNAPVATTPAPTTAAPVATLPPVATTPPPTTPSPVASVAPTTSPVAITPSPVAAVTPAPTPTAVEFAGILTLQQQAGVCGNPDDNGIGCAETNNSGDGGNPNDLVNCYNITEVSGGSAPFALNSVRFWLGARLVPPSDLNLRVWNSLNGAPTTQLLEQSLTGYVVGENSFALTTPLIITNTEFCVGVNSQNVNEGLRVQNEVGPGFQSFVFAPQCGTQSFTSLATLNLPGRYCIEAFVSSP